MSYYYISYNKLICSLHGCYFYNRRIPLTSLVMSPETLHKENSLRARCNVSNRSATVVDGVMVAFSESSVDRSARCILNTAVTAVIAIADSTLMPNAGPPIVLLIRILRLFLSFLIASNSVTHQYRSFG